MRRWNLHRILCGAMLGFFLSLVPVACYSQEGGVFARDVESEELLIDYARPIFQAAGLEPGVISVRIVRRKGYDAFVVDSRNIYISAGLLIQAKTPSEVIGVIAHETGHIVLNHVPALRKRLKEDASRTLIASLLSLGAIAAVVASGGEGSSVAEIGKAASVGLSSGTASSLAAAQYKEQRANEGAADEKALSLLNATKQSGRGLLTAFGGFVEDDVFHKEVFSERPYLRTHPAPRERISRLRKRVEASPYFRKKNSPELRLRHDLVRAKMLAFFDKPAQTLRVYPPSDKTLPARYARAIATYKKRKIEPSALSDAMRQVDRLIESAPPGYPYFYQLKGRFLFDSGKPGQAIAWYEKALKLRPKVSYLHLNLAEALIEKGGSESIKRSIKHLNKSLATDVDSNAYFLLARAYFLQKRRGLADAMMAQAYFSVGNMKQAKRFAKRARGKLKQGTRNWIKNEDIVTAGG